MATEQIWANQLRFYRETSPRSGVPDGDVWTLPVGPAASARRTEAWGGRVDVFRNPQPLLSLHEYHEGRMAFTVGLRFLGWLLTLHATAQGGNVWTFDRNAPTPTFALEVQTQTDAFVFRGIGFNEIQIAATPPELVTLDLSFIALDRQPIVALTAATGDLYSAPVPSNVCVMAYTSGNWQAVPRVDDFYTGAYGVQFYLTRRDLAPSQFMPDGRPERQTSVPWRVMADVRSAATALTRQAKTRATGRIGLFLGALGHDLQLVADVATLFSQEDPVKATDFREESLMVEMHPDPAGSLLSVRDNSGLIP